MIISEKVVMAMRFAAFPQLAGNLVTRCYKLALGTPILPQLVVGLPKDEIRDDWHLEDGVWYIDLPSSQRVLMLTFCSSTESSVVVDAINCVGQTSKAFIGRVTEGQEWTVPDADQLSRLVVVMPIGGSYQLYEVRRQEYIHLEMPAHLFLAPGRACAGS